MAGMHPGGKHETGHEVHVLRHHRYSDVRSQICLGDTELGASTHNTLVSWIPAQGFMIRD